MLQFCHKIYGQTCINKSVIHHEIDVVWTVPCLKPHKPDKSVWIKIQMTVSCNPCALNVQSSWHVRSADWSPKRIERICYSWGGLEIDVNLSNVENRSNCNMWQGATSYILSTTVTNTAETAPQAAPLPALKHDAKLLTPPSIEIWTRAVVLELQRNQTKWWFRGYNNVYINLKLKSSAYNSTCSYHRHSK